MAGHGPGCRCPASDDPTCYFRPWVFPGAYDANGLWRPLPQTEKPPAKFHWKNPDCYLDLEGPPSPGRTRSGRAYGTDDLPRTHMQACVSGIVHAQGGRPTCYTCLTACVQPALLRDTGCCCQTRKRSSQVEPEQIQLLAVVPDDVVHLEPEQIKLLAAMPDDVVQL